MCIPSAVVHVIAVEIVRLRGTALKATSASASPRATGIRRTVLRRGAGDLRHTSCRRLLAARDRDATRVRRGDLLSEFAPSMARQPVAFLVDLLAAIPSVVYGLWGIFVLQPLLREHVMPLRSLAFRSSDVSLVRGPGATARAC